MKTEIRTFSLINNERLILVELRSNSFTEPKKVSLQLYNYQDDIILTPNQNSQVNLILKDPEVVLVCWKLVPVSKKPTTIFILFKVENEESFLSTVINLQD